MDRASVLDMRVAEKNSEWLGVSATALMGAAGRGIAREARKLGDKWYVFCGPGNNGGDGFAAAYCLGRDAAVYYSDEPKSEAAKYYFNLIKGRNRVTRIADAGSLPRLDGIVLDCIFGTGVRGRIREPYKGMIRHINQSGCKVLSADLPSGIDPESGSAPDIVVRPDLIVAMHKCKFIPKGGVKTVVVDIELPKKAEKYVGPGDMLYVPARNEESHKSDNGRVLVVGGNDRFVGAPYFAGMAALTSGCDLAYVFAPADCAKRLAQMSPDLIVMSAVSRVHLRESDIGGILRQDFDVLCLGNGLGAEKQTMELVRWLLKKVDNPMVIDGDAIRAIKGWKGRENVVVTPHAQEFRDAFGGGALANDIKRRERAARDASRRFGGTILLKGKTDVIARRGKTKLNGTGNSYMTKGGTGDVLAGLCAGFMAQGTKPFNAACVSAFINGLAGDIAREKLGRAMLASDVLACLPHAFKRAGLE